VPGPDLLIAYGPAPGMELIPYFLAMLAWAGLAVLSIVAWPFVKAWRRIRGKRAEAVEMPAAPPAANPPVPADAQKTTDQPGA
jgi:hypothetical protein